MAAQKLSLQTIGDLDGGMARGVIDSAINTIVHDLDDRGDDGKPRLAVIELELKKDLEMGFVVVNVTAKAKIPPYRVGGTVAEFQQVGGECQVQFRSNSPDNPKQLNMIDDAIESGAKPPAAE